MSEILKKWIMVNSSSTPLVELVEFHGQHSVQILKEMKEIRSTPESLAAALEEVIQFKAAAGMGGEQ